MYGGFALSLHPLLVILYRGAVYYAVQDGSNF